MGAPVVAPLTGHLDAALTNFAKQFRNNALVSDIIFPRVPVGRQTDKYYIYAREHQELLQQTLRGTGAPAQRIRLSISTDSYKCESHALAADIPDEDRAGYGPGQLDQNVTQALIDKILLDKESAAITLISDTSTITNYDSLDNPSEKWTDEVNSKPLDDVDVGRDSIRKAGVEANVMVINPTLFRALRQHEKLKEAFKYTTPGSLGLGQLASYFGIPQVLLAAAVSVSKAGAVSYLMGNHAFLGYVNPGASVMDISFAKTFVWQAAPGTIGGFGTVTGRHSDPTAKSDILGVDFYYDQKVTAVESAYLIANAA